MRDFVVLHPVRLSPERRALPGEVIALPDGPQAASLLQAGAIAVAPAAADTGPDQSQAPAAAAPARKRGRTAKGKE